MPNFLINRAFLTPNRIALICGERSYTFQQVFEKAKGIAGLLTFYGIKQNQQVGVLLKNNVDTVWILYALQLLGVKAVLLNNRLSAEELIWQLKDSEATALLTEESFQRESDSIQTEVNPFLILDKEMLFSTTHHEPNVIEEINLEDICSIMYTSGTTGNPKGVLQTYGNHWWSATGSALNLGITEKDRWLCAVPLFHISGYSILMRSLIYGIAVVLHPTFDEKAIIRDIQDKKVTIMSVVSTMLSRILQDLEDNLLPDYFRCMLLGGGPAPLPLLETCESKNIPVFQTYGMTETSSQMVTLAPEYSLLKLGSAGKPLFPSQIKIVNEEGLEVDQNIPGEIIVKGPNVTKGYLNRPKDTEEKIKDGWLYTGDIGYVDEEGFLYVLDRRSDLIISGGENIYPAEIEGVLSSHPDILDVGVIGKDDPIWGQIPIAFIVRRNYLTEAEVTTFCAGKLAKYKIPKEIRFIEELPRNAAKKLLRRELRYLLKEDRS
jgi:O-succinylbenzoic acid--CoA ligase